MTSKRFGVPPSGGAARESRIASEFSRLVERRTIDRLKAGLQTLCARFIVVAALIPSLRADLRVAINSEEIPERGTVTRYMIQSSLGIFSLIPPNGWGSGLNRAEESLNFQFESANAVFSLKFSTNAPPQSAEQIKELLSERWPNAQIVEQTGASTRDSQGKAVECVYAAAGALNTFRTRLAFVPYAGGHIELTLSAPEEWPSILHNSWTTILNSFQSEKPSARRIFSGG